MPLPELRPQSEIDAMDRFERTRSGSRGLPLTEAAMGLVVLLIFHVLM